ncbi:integration host factor subunit alpha [Psychrobacter ciconiae]|uniref:integration host factor subunit alpha n=1 Tax=Psychrobacter ciconiae TaxID=1553449 RepID=UPI001918E579|nr:integration host factor subunit alpha [Psychrobacter ciconiae]
MSTLTKSDMIEHLMQRLNLTRQEGRCLVENFFEELSDSLIEGKEVKLSGFGNFELKDKNSRPGRNPKTGEPVNVSARRVVTFKTGQKFRQQIDAQLFDKQA